MATITAGAGATFTATKAEAQAIAALNFLNQRENTSEANPNGDDRINASFDVDLLTFAGTYSLPASQVLNSLGQLVIVSTPYLSSGAFTPGTGGTFKSVTIEAYVLEVLMYLQSLELQPTKNPQNRNYITGTYNSDSKLYAGTFNLPISISIPESGIVSFTAVEYLLS